MRELFNNGYNGISKICSNRSAKRNILPVCFFDFRNAIPYPLHLKLAVFCFQIERFDIDIFQCIVDFYRNGCGCPCVEIFRCGVTKKVCYVSWINLPWPVSIRSIGTFARIDCGSKVPVRSAADTFPGRRGEVPRVSIAFDLHVCLLWLLIKEIRGPGRKDFAARQQGCLDGQ